MECEGTEKETGKESMEKLKRIGKEFMENKLRMFPFHS